MSTSTIAAPAAPPLIQRLVHVARLHLANPTTILTTPLLILAAIFAVNWMLWWLIAANATGQDRADATDGLSWSGASAFLFVYMMVVAVQAVSVTFPFALGYGVTRRDYYLGSALTFVGLSVFYTAVFTVLAVLEEATGGWGVRGRMFTALYFGDGAWTERSFAVLALFLFFFFVGAAASAVWVRWRATGLTTFFVTLAFLVVGSAVLITWAGAWPTVGGVFGDLGWTGSYAASLVLTAIAAVAGFLILRRATPRG